MNTANRLTILRVLLIPVFMVFVLMDTSSYRYIAAFIFFIAALTDTLDGYIARSRNQITVFGKFMDPLADKLLITAALITLVELGEVASWVAMVIIAREFAITGFRILAAADGVVIAASWWGKIKTITQIVAIISILLNNFPFSVIGFPFDRIFLGLAVVFTVISGIDYIYINRKIFTSNDNK